MSLVHFDNLSQAYGGFDVFQHLSGRIDEHSKIGLVGPNGIGKTSLLKILAGLEEETGGTLTLAPDLRIGYLRQEAALAFADTQNTLYDEMLIVFERVFLMERQMRAIEARMAAGGASEADYDHYDLLQDAVERGGLYEYERRIERTLAGLGFSQAEYGKSLDILSGGQKTRALLAKLLLEMPDLLVLDEPTNHLDVEAIRWLEGTLSVWKGAVLVVSHDRYFLDRVVNRVWELNHDGLESYKGNYSAYLDQRQQRRERLQFEWDAMMERFWHEFEIIRTRTLADPNAKGRFRRLSREVEAVESNGLDGLRYIQKNGWMQYTQQFARSNPSQTVSELAESLNNLQNPVRKHKNMRLKLMPEEISGELVMRGRNLSVGYQRGEALFKADDIDLIRGEVAALIGPNGAGKSTFLKTLLGEIRPLKGHITYGDSVQVGYFAQAHDGLDQNNSVLDELMRHNTGFGIQASRHHLAQYLFTGDDVFKEVSELSGGERGRLALAILALQGANLLLLDEPTNHLDVPSQEVLQSVLERFDGTIILVTHDRYLVDRLATQIWDLNAGHLRVFKHDYRDYLAQIEAERAAADPQPKPEPKPQAPTIDPQLIQRLEAQVISLEGEIKELETLLSVASKSGDSSTIEVLSKQYTTQKKRLAEIKQEREELAIMA